MVDATLGAQTFLAQLGASPVDAPVLPNDRLVTGFLAALARTTRHPDYRALVADRVAGRLDRAGFESAVDALVARLESEVEPT